MISDADDDYSGQSKTAKMLTTVELAERYGKDGLVALSLHVRVSAWM